MISLACLLQLSVTPLDTVVLTYGSPERGVRQPLSHINTSTNSHYIHIHTHQLYYLICNPTPQNPLLIPLKSTYPHFITNFFISMVHPAIELDQIFIEICQNKSLTHQQILDHLHHKRHQMTLWTLQRHLRRLQLTPRELMSLKPD